MTSLVTLFLSLSLCPTPQKEVCLSKEEPRTGRNSPVSCFKQTEFGLTGRVKYLALRLSRTEPEGFIRPGLKWQTEN